MSILLEKSKQNYNASEILIKNNYHASSVHCSYYSCVQLMIHLLLTKLGYSQETIDEACKIEKKGSHQFAINTLNKKMISMNIRFDSSKFDREIKKLKNFREQADYHEIEIDSDFSNEALTFSKSINQILTKTFLQNDK